MTSTLRWTGEVFPPYGALAAEGFAKLLGRPSLDPLTVLVRETAQNSWDARLSRASVRYSLHGFTFSGRQRTALRERVFAELPPAGLPLADSLVRERLDALVISDRHTLGLGGPTRADRPTDGPTDFVDLVMNVGVGGHDFGGGTYGFGKTIAYIVSRARTVVVYSRSSHGLPKVETRLIATAIGDAFDHRRRRYTGRHWWGRDRSGSPEPLTGRSADALARAIGLPAFDDETGTTIMVIDPDFGDHGPEGAMRFLADAITWHLWPKMVRRRGRQPMHFAVRWNGQQIPVARPEDVPPLHGYARSLEALHEHDEPVRRADGLEVVAIRSQRPNRRLGRLALYTFVARSRGAERSAAAGAGDDDVEPATAAAFTGNSHHVALLRAPELVVTYMSGPQLPDASLEWAGVFICDRDVDTVFAASEPPTHDDWQPRQLPEKQDRTIVNVALREIREAVRLRTSPAPMAGRAEAGSVAVVADALAGLTAGVPDSGPGRVPRPGPGASGRRHGHPRVMDPRCGPVLIDGVRLTRLTFVLDNPSRQRVDLTIRTGVATNDGSDIETDPPAGSIGPVLVRVAGPVTVDDIGAEQAVLGGLFPEASEWSVLATSPDDVMVAFTVDATSGQDPQST